jgi:hypothetical protein
MTKHSRRERERRAQETDRMRQIEAAWAAALSPERANAFRLALEAARARGPLPPPPDMAPGTPPRPPRREPRPAKDAKQPRRRSW